jgi:hypothetical protein
MGEMRAPAGGFGVCRPVWDPFGAPHGSVGHLCAVDPYAVPDDVVSRCVDMLAAFVRLDDAAVTELGASLIFTDAPGTDATGWHAVLLFARLCATAVFPTGTPVGVETFYAALTALALDQSPVLRRFDIYVARLVCAVVSGDDWWPVVREVMGGSRDVAVAVFVRLAEIASVLCVDVLPGG